MSVMSAKPYYACIVTLTKEGMIRRYSGKDHTINSSTVILHKRKSKQVTL